jgi:hypothetical protein
MATTRFPTTTIMKRSTGFRIQKGWLCILLLAPCPAKADAVNEDRVLRKAGGIAEGKMTNVKVRINGGPLQDSFNRTGKVRIPTDEGPERSVVIHGPVPDADFNTLTQGNVKRADVLRLGKLILYSGVGTNQYFDGFGTFAGGGVARSTVRGPKVISSGSVRGARVNSSTDDTESAQSDGSSRSNF